MKEKQIYESSKELNLAALAREFNVDYRTIKKAIDRNKTKNEYKKRNRDKKSFWHKYNSIIVEKLEGDNTKRAVFLYLIEKYKIKEGESSFYKYCNRRIPKFRIIENIYLPIFYMKGEQFQADWKENKRITFSNGETIIFNVFGLVSSYSKKVIFVYSENKKLENLFRCLTYAFEKFNGVPESILFDNMKTVVDISKSVWNGEKVFNSKMLNFGNDFGFKVKATKVRSPQQKGIIESKMKILDGLDVWNNELDSVEELKNKIKYLEDKANERKVNNKIIPNEKHKNEISALKSLPDRKIINYYKFGKIIRRVNKNSAILYKNNYYSCPKEYLNKDVEIILRSDHMDIYKGGLLIASHRISANKFNYSSKDISSILSLDKYKQYRTKFESEDKAIENAFKRLRRKNV